MDPRKTYYTYAIGIINAIHRGLYAYQPADPLEPMPDLAEGMPEISEDGKTVTVKIKKGVMFSKPVSREVTSADVKYAIERAFTADVANGYARVYFGDLVGAAEGAGPYKEIPGIETPDDQTIVFKLTKGTGAALAGALAMPISVPVPKEYAEKYDKETPSTYGEGYAVYTGPYMVESDAKGKAIGYVPGKRIHLVRNPDYAEVDDFRPAFVDEIDIQAGNEDTSVATRRILSGESMISGEIEPPAQPAQAAAGEQQDRAVGGPGRWLAHDLDRQQPPAVRRHQRPQGRDRGLQPQRGAPAARRRGARADRPAPDPAGHGGLRGVRRRRGLVDEFDWLQAGGRPRQVGRVLQGGGLRLRASTRAPRSS